VSDIKEKYDRMHHRIDPWDEVHRLQEEVKKLKEENKKLTQMLTYGSTVLVH
jgi:cell shape-determining protein MreC